MSTDYKGEVKYRYSEFHNMHSKLRKIVFPARLPAFPSKTYFSNLRQLDISGLERRRLELEIYMTNVLNDPAFHC